jgi:NADH-quinone oxidoreductase subunit B/C/D
MSSEGLDGHMRRRLPTADETRLSYDHPLYRVLLKAPGASVGVGVIDQVLQWGLVNSLWVFPLGTSCCAIELMAAAASRVDLDRMGTIVRATPRQADVMVVAGTITVKMAPRVKTLWEQMPEPKWAIAMGSCAISGDFYRNLYSVVPGVDTIVPVDVYVPGCPPNPEALMHGLLRLQEKVRLRRAGLREAKSYVPGTLELTQPSVARLLDAARDPAITAAQETSATLATRQEAPDTAHAEADETPALAVETGAPEADVAALLAEMGVTDTPKDAAPVVKAEQHVTFARRLRDAGYRQLVYVVATHYPEITGAKARPESFEVAYALRTVGEGSRLASWRVQLAKGESAPSLVGVFAGADWQEREQFDLVGIRFEGHPDLRRIMLPDTWSGHPLRKDYAADTACPPWR